MEHRPSQRARSPPFSYEPRHMLGDREFDGPYNEFAEIHRHQPMPMLNRMNMHIALEPPDAPPGVTFMERGRQDYPESYRDNCLPSAYRHVMREPHVPTCPPTGPSSPTYKILCISNINTKIDDTTVKNALLSDFSRFGHVSVSVCHDNGERFAYIYFRNYEEAREARMTKSRTLFFDRPIEIEPIYEPNDSPSRGLSPPTSFHPIMSQQPGIYSPRARSITPTDQYYDLSIPHEHRRVFPHHMQHAQTLNPAINMNRRPISPPGFMPMPAGYSSHSINSPPVDTPMVPHGYDRHLPGHVSPYSSPPQDPYRSPYTSGPHYSPSSYQMAGHAPPLPPSQMGRGDRDRIYSESRFASSRSPRSHDPHQLPAPQSHSYSAGLRSSSIYDKHPSPSASYQPNPSVPSRYRQVSPTPRAPNSTRPDPPARFMSREYRREKYGNEHGHEHEDGRPSRVLLINNIDSVKTQNDLRTLFEPMGIIEEIEMKRVNSEVSSALIRFSSMDGAYKAKSANQGRHIGRYKCNIVYGKISASRRLWIGGLSSSTTVQSLEDDCNKYGDLINMEYTSGRPYSYVEFETANQAQFAAYHLRSTLVPAPDRKIRIEFVDPERSEKMSRHDANPKLTESRALLKRDRWAVDDKDSSPPRLLNRKRSISPMNSSSKRTCTDNEVLIANTLKHERLLAAGTVANTHSSSANSSNSDRAINSPPDEVDHNDDSSKLTSNGKARDDVSDSNDKREDVHESIQEETPSVDILNQCSSIRQMVTFCPTSWDGQILLRNFLFPCNLHLLAGSKNIVDQHLISTCVEGSDSTSIPTLRITQRWRLHPQPKLEEVRRRMLAGNLATIIITSRQESNTAKTAKAHQDPSQNGRDTTATNPREENSEQQGGDMGVCKDIEGHKPPISLMYDAQPGARKDHPVIEEETQARPLRNLISYLEQKDAAGVISLSVSGGLPGHSKSGDDINRSPKLLYTFPPGNFALALIRNVASQLMTKLTKEIYLLGILVDGSVDGK